MSHTKISDRSRDLFFINVVINEIMVKRKTCWRKCPFDFKEYTWRGGYFATCMRVRCLGPLKCSKVGETLLEKLPHFRRFLVWSLLAGNLCKWKDSILKLVFICQKINNLFL